MVRTPRPFSLLMLENGGGKSVLLKLVFSVVLPGRRNTLGGSGSVLEKFVVGDDAAHVVLEWLHVKTGERVLTGKTYEWRRGRGDDGTKLTEAWWSARPTGALDITTLPFTREGRRLRAGAFRAALAECDQIDPLTQMMWAGSDHGTWTEHLSDLGIDPELFAIQRQMNAVEGDAANAFKFPSSKAFVDWLLRIALDEEDAASVAETFEGFARNVGDRHALLLEKDFGDGAVAAMRPAAAAHATAGTAAAGQADAQQMLVALATAVGARTAAEEASAAVQKVELRQALEKLTACEGERDRARSTRPPCSAGLGRETLPRSRWSGAHRRLENPGARLHQFGACWASRAASTPRDQPERTITRPPWCCQLVGDHHRGI